MSTPRNDKEKLLLEIQRLDEVAQNENDLKVSCLLKLVEARQLGVFEPHELDHLAFCLGVVWMESGNRLDELRQKLDHELDELEQGSAKRHEGGTLPADG